MLGFQKGRGMRLDLALVNPALAARVTDAWVDRDARRGQGAVGPRAARARPRRRLTDRTPGAAGLRPVDKSRGSVDKYRPGPSCSTASHGDVDGGWMGYAPRETLTSPASP